MSLNLIEKLGDEANDPEVDVPKPVIILGLARCPCAIRSGWKAFRKQKLNQASLFTYYSSSSSSTEIEGTGNLPYFQRSRIAWFQDYADAAVNESEMKVKVQ